MGDNQILEKSLSAFPQKNRIAALGNRYSSVIGRAFSNPGVAFLMPLAAVGLVAAVVLGSRRHLLFWFFDGAWLLDLLRSQKDWALSADWTYDPVRGPFGLFPIGQFTRSPIFWLVDLVFKPAINPAPLFVAYALSIAALMQLAARMLRLSVMVGALASWIVLALAMPFFWGSGGTLMVPIFILTPENFESSLIFAGCLLGFASLGHPRLRLPLTICAIAGAALVYELDLMPPLSSLILPPVAAAALLLTGLSRTRREFLVKLAVIGVVAAGVAGTGAIGFTAALALNSPAAFFAKELPPYQGGLLWSSMLFQWERYGLGSFVTLASGLGGMAVAIVNWRKLRSAIAIQLALVVALLNLGMWLIWPLLIGIDSFVYPLPFIATLRLLYFEIVFFYATAFMAAFTIAYVAGRLVAWAAARMARPLDGLAPAATALTILVIVLVAISYARNPTFDGYNPYRYPPRPTAITAVLGREIAIAPGQPFRGRVATLSDRGPGRDRVDWDSTILSDIQQMNITGNDSRFDGLWYFDIPTLQQFSQIISPALYLLTTRLLASAQTVQDQRNTVVLSRANDDVLRLLGVRFLITSSTSPSATRGDVRASAGDRSLVELADPNVGGWSVRRVERLADARAVLGKLLDHPDLHEVAYVIDGDALEGLRAATVTITPRRGVIGLSGHADGRALVVLPIQYSSCLVIGTARPGLPAPRLVRADLALTGLVFDGELDANLSLRVAPSDAECLYRESAALHRIGLTEAAEAFPPPGLRSAPN